MSVSGIDRRDARAAAASGSPTTEDTADRSASRARTILVSLVLASVAAVAWLALAADIGIDLSDEGYFWYGAQRVLRGEFPIRDFMSYDPARYVYAATFFRLVGSDGLMAARGAAIVVFAASACIASCVVLRARAIAGKPARSSWIFSGVLVAFLLFWMFPYYKAFDQFACVLLIAAVYHVLLRRTSRSWLWLGVAVGFVATIGRNHGIYGVCASLIAAALLARGWHPRSAASNAIAWVAGVVIGYAPILLALVFVDGFFRPFIDGVLGLLRGGETNIGLPTPWPWNVDVRTQGIALSLHPLAVGVAFVLLPIVPWLGVYRLWRTKGVDDESAAFLAALAVSVPYAWYAFSRADLTHLVLPVYALLIAAFVQPFEIGRMRQAALLLTLVVLSGLVLFETPMVNYLLVRERNWVPLQLADKRIFVEKGQDEMIERRLSILGDAAAAHRSFLAMPDMPTLHAALRMPMPVHDIYVLAATSPSEEDLEVRRLDAARPDLILVSDAALDHKDAWRFSRLRPRTYAWIRDNYARSDTFSKRGKDPLQVFERAAPR